ncbi:hypothetical protein BDN71DRAFT_1505925 [Pleurotus eryngii]|uniref:peptidylprolyl isomerase n=1 Tax=Pleurotus eryngii TaxID=5323 RepID=A0A9P6A025_PLEER|nr:hypothetical protein BDN71DRAFT_1505925 [Pleurotus eryngii]
MKGHKQKANTITDNKTSTLPSKRKPVTRLGSVTISSARAMMVTASTAAIAPTAPASAPTTVAAATTTLTFMLPNGMKCTEKSMGKFTGPAVHVGDDVEIYFVMSLPGSFKFTVGNPAIIEGLNTGIVGMHHIGECHIEIPAALAFKKTIPVKGLVYGARGKGVIPLGSKILMKVKLCYIILPISGTT